MYLYNESNDRKHVYIATLSHAKSIGNFWAERIFYEEWKDKGNRMVVGAKYN